MVCLLSSLTMAKLGACVDQLNFFCICTIFRFAAYKISAISFIEIAPSSDSCTDKFCNESCTNVGPVVAAFAAAFTEEEADSGFVFAGAGAVTLNYVSTIP